MACCSSPRWKHTRTHTPQPDHTTLHAQHTALPLQPCQDVDLLREMGDAALYTVEHIPFIGPYVARSRQHGARIVTSMARAMTNSGRHNTLKATMAAKRTAQSIRAGLDRIKSSPRSQKSEEDTTTTSSPRHKSTRSQSSTKAADAPVEGDVQTEFPTAASNSKRLAKLPSLGNGAGVGAGAGAGAGVGAGAGSGSGSLPRLKPTSDRSLLTPSVIRTPVTRHATANGSPAVDSDIEEMRLAPNAHSPVAPPGTVTPARVRPETEGSATVPRQTRSAVDRPQYGRQRGGAPGRTIMSVSSWRQQGSGRSANGGAGDVSISASANDVGSTGAAAAAAGGEAAVAPLGGSRATSRSMPTMGSHGERPTGLFTGHQGWAPVAEVEVRSPTLTSSAAGSTPAGNSTASGGGKEKAFKFDAGSSSPSEGGDVAASKDVEELVKAAADFCNPSP